MAEVNEIGEPKYLTRSPLPGVDWITFFDAVEEAFNLYLQSAGPPGQKAPIFVSDFPKDNNGNFDTSFDVILYHTAGSIRSGTDPSGKRRIPKGPNMREVKPHPNKGRYSLVTMGWWETMTVCFTTYALSHDRADEVGCWFHRMMMQFILLGFFKMRGVNDLRFDQRYADEFSKQYGQELYVRKYSYNVRLELKQSFEVKDLESINIAIPEGPDFTVTEHYQIPKP